MNYTLKSIRINSQWFDKLDRKKNVYQKITYKGLYLYFQLYKFRLHNQENEHTFITSVAMLRKETGYTTDEIFDLLKKLKSSKIIKVENVSRWEYLLDDKGEIKDKDCLMITATDTFPISDYKRTDDEFYIYIPFGLFEKYKELGLNEKYISLYCLIKKWSNNTESKMWMSIEKMANFLGFDKDYVNQMIYQMNRYYLMSSKRRNREPFGYYFEHYILDTIVNEKVESFVNSHKESMDKLIKRVDKKKVKAKSNKKQVNIEDEFETIEDTEPVLNEAPKKTKSEEPKLAFGTRKAQVKKSWGNDVPFGDVDSKHIRYEDREDLWTKEELDYFEKAMS